MAETVKKIRRNRLFPAAENPKMSDKPVQPWKTFKSELLNIFNNNVQRNIKLICDDISPP